MVLLECSEHTSSRSLRKRGIQRVSATNCYLQGLKTVDNRGRSSVNCSAFGHGFRTVTHSSCSDPYNVGTAGARAVLQAADQQLAAAVGNQMRDYIFIHPRDAQGHRLPPVRVQALVNRRNEEAAPFDNNAGAR
jgi:hypothetical protein